MNPRKRTFWLALMAIILAAGCGDEPEGEPSESRKEQPSSESSTDSQDDCVVIVQGSPACAEEAEMCGTTRVLTDGRCCIIGGDCGKQ